jgi:hypothetical protein
MNEASNYWVGPLAAYLAAGLALVALAVLAVVLLLVFIRAVVTGETYVQAGREIARLLRADLRPR